jgi:hypothetical protein
MEAKAVKTAEAVCAAKEYLMSRVEDGLCLGFHQLRHGPSLAWTTTCVGSTLAALGSVAPGMLEAVLSLQWNCGGWSYNQNSVPDADSTLRVLQFLAKVGFSDHIVIDKAEAFVISHQQADGGIATYRPEAVAVMGYPEGGWTASHPCVTALAVNVLRDGQARNRARRFLEHRLEAGDARAYWWETPWYVRYEAGWANGEPIGDDPVEIGLALLLKAKLGMADEALTTKLMNLQQNDGSFPASHQFRIPRPHQFLDNIPGDVEKIEDRTRVFSTAAAAVAISRQGALLH